MSYWIKCPLGTYCGYIAKDPLRCPLCGGYCKPWLTTIFRDLENQMGKDEIPPTSETPSTMPRRTPETKPVVQAIKIPPIELSSGPEDWQTFTNGNYYYSVNYPGDWPTVASIEAGEKTPAIGMHGEAIKGGGVYLAKYAPGANYEPPFLFVGVSLDQPQSVIESQLNSARSRNCANCEITESTILGFPIYIYHEIPSNNLNQPRSTDSNLHYYRAVIFRGNDIYELSWDEGSSEDSGLFMQILSTFKFLE